MQGQTPGQPQGQGQGQAGTQQEVTPSYVRTVLHQGFLAQNNASRNQQLHRSQQPQNQQFHPSQQPQNQQLHPSQQPQNQQFHPSQQPQNQQPGNLPPTPHPPAFQNPQLVHRYSTQTPQFTPGISTQNPQVNPGISSQNSRLPLNNSQVRNPAQFGNTFSWSHSQNARLPRPQNPQLLQTQTQNSLLTQNQPRIPQQNVQQHQQHQNYLQNSQLSQKTQSPHLLNLLRPLDNTQGHPSSVQGHFADIQGHANDTQFRVNNVQGHASNAPGHATRMPVPPQYQVSSSSSVLYSGNHGNSRLPAPQPGPTNANMAGASAGRALTSTSAAPLPMPGPGGSSAPPFSLTPETADPETQALFKKFCETLVSTTLGGQNLEDLASLMPGLLGSSSSIGTTGVSSDAIQGQAGSSSAIQENANLRNPTGIGQPTVQQAQVRPNLQVPNQLQRQQGHQHQSVHTQHTYPAEGLMSVNSPLSLEDILRQEHQVPIRTIKQEPIEHQQQPGAGVPTPGLRHVQQQQQNTSVPAQVSGHTQQQSAGVPTIGSVPMQQQGAGIPTPGLQHVQQQSAGAPTPSLGPTHPGSIPIQQQGVRVPVPVSRPIQLQMPPNASVVPASQTDAQGHNQPHNQPPPQNQYVSQGSQLVPPPLYVSQAGSSQGHMQQIPALPAGGPPYSQPTQPGPAANHQRPPRAVPLPQVQPGPQGHARPSAVAGQGVHGSIFCRIKQEPGVPTPQHSQAALLGSGAGTVPTAVTSHHQAQLSLPGNHSNVGGPPQLIHYGNQGNVMPQVPGGNQGNVYQIDHHGNVIRHNQGNVMPQVPGNQGNVLPQLAVPGNQGNHADPEMQDAALLQQVQMLKAEVEDLKQQQQQLYKIQQQHAHQQGQAVAMATSTVPGALNIKSESGCVVKREPGVAMETNNSEGGMVDIFTIVLDSDSEDEQNNLGDSGNQAGESSNHGDTNTQGDAASIATAEGPEDVTSPPSPGASSDTSSSPDTSLTPEERRATLRKRTRDDVTSDGQYFCQDCFRFLRHQEDLTSHGCDRSKAGINMRDMKGICHVCHIYTSDPSGHAASHEPGTSGDARQIYACVPCKSYYRTSVLAKIHAQTCHKRSFADVIRVITPDNNGNQTGSDVSTSPGNHSNKERKEYFCEDCRRLFRYKEDLEQHIKEERSCNRKRSKKGIPGFYCDSCGKYILTRAQYAGHRRAHDKRGKHYACTVCLTFYKNEGAAQMHAASCHAPWVKAVLMTRLELTRGGETELMWVHLPRNQRPRQPRSPSKGQRQVKKESSGVVVRLIDIDPTTADNSPAALQAARDKPETSSSNDVTDLEAAAPCETLVGQLTCPPVTSDHGQSNDDVEIISVAETPNAGRIDNVVELSSDDDVSITGYTSPDVTNTTTTAIMEVVPKQEPSEDVRYTCVPCGVTLKLRGLLFVHLRIHHKLSKDAANSALERSQGRVTADYLPAM